MTQENYKASKNDTSKIVEAQNCPLQPFCMISLLINNYFRSDVY